MRGLVIAGTHSGVGKTTVATGLMKAFSRKGLRVQPFKVGPDYIDPSYHTLACGTPSRNLDTWLLEEPVVVELFQKAMQGQDLAVIEGVMGLYDGFRGDGEEGSTAHIAKLLRLPVVLVVDVRASARSSGATVLGFKLFDTDLNIAGVILNGVAGESHLESIKLSLVKSGIPVLGYLPRRQEMALPERHLGLVPISEGAVGREFYERLAGQIEETVDLDRVLALSNEISGIAKLTGLFPEKPVPAKVAIAIARDKAFNFYYQDSLDLLHAWGAEIVFFSSLDDPEIPKGVGGVYIGGGFPELYARELSENTTMLQSLKRFASRGMPIYAECGGLMYLGETTEDRDGQRYPMAGIVPAVTSINNSHLTLGYRTACALKDNMLLNAGEQVRGHEFHLSSLKNEPEPATAVYQLLGQQGRCEGFHVNNVIASYIHLHFASKPNLAPRFVDFCCKLKPN